MCYLLALSFMNITYLLKGSTCPFMHTKEPLPTETKEEENMCSICYNVCGTLRKFGLLSNCDHVFCLDCIRTWRVSSKANGSHTCPMCRVKSHFVIPSLVYATGAQKKEIEEHYKTKLKSIPCKYFNFGDGTCPFYNNCFYGHLNADGTPATITKPPPSRRKIVECVGRNWFMPGLLGLLDIASDDESGSDDDFESYDATLMQLQLHMLLEENF